MRWIVKRHDMVFDYNAPETEREAFRERLTREIQQQADDGWEPWHMVGAVIGSVEHVTVWLKRPGNS